MRNGRVSLVESGRSAGSESKVSGALIPAVPATATEPQSLCRVSDAGPLAVYEAARRAGVRKPSGKEPAVGGVGVAVYGDLAAERLGRVMRWALE